MNRQTKGSILIADDEPMLLKTSSIILTNKGYDVHSCVDGQEAVEYFKRNWKDIDIVILDMSMPGLSGVEAFRVMRTINSQVQVLMSTGMGVEGDKNKLLDEGVVGFIQKPFRSWELGQLVEKFSSQKL